MMITQVASTATTTKHTIPWGVKLTFPIIFEAIMAENMHLHTQSHKMTALILGTRALASFP